MIVDDLVQSGGTLAECARALKHAGARAVSAYVTHAVFPLRAWARFAHGTVPEGDVEFEHFWCTDSCPTTVRQIEGLPPFKIISLAPRIAEALCS